MNPSMSANPASRPAFMASWISGGSAAKSKSCPGPSPSWSSRSQRSSRPGAGFPNRSMATSRKPKNRSSNWAPSSHTGNSRMGGAGGGSVPRKPLSGSSVYSAWISPTLARSSGPNSWVRTTMNTRSVSLRSTSSTPSGAAPSQPGPAMRKVPASLPVLSVPT